MTLSGKAAGAALAAPVRSVARVGYGLYAWIVFVLLAFGAVCCAAILPGVERRRRVIHAVSKLVLRLGLLRINVRSLDLLPAGQCVVVANHASYLDGVVFTAVLPPRFGFIIKREMSRVPLAGLLLRRLGSLFVERATGERGANANDARRVLRTALNGSSLVFFPEGTFAPAPGLLRFHVGAFATAVRVGCPIVPAVMRGTRAVLPPRAWLPRRAHIEVEFLAPLKANAQSASEAVVELRDRTRALILERLQEPDLAA